MKLGAETSSIVVGGGSIYQFLTNYSNYYSIYRMNFSKLKLIKSYLRSTKCHEKD